MVSLIHTIKTKGVLNTIKRTGNIIKRYSFDGLANSLAEMINVIEEYDARVTLPITALTLKRNMDLIKKVDSKSIEWAMHGYVHTDYTKIDANTIEKHIEKGKKIFKEANIEMVGFRAPYLRVNQTTLGMLSKHNFLYDSSKCYYIDGLSPLKKDVKKILNYYKPLQTREIRKIHGITEIPLSLPDDEMLVDRLNYKGKDVGKIWVRMSNIIKKEGQIPVIQLHPERGSLCKQGLQMVLEWARKNDLDVLQLRDIVKRKNHNVLAITGDIDVIKISDFGAMRKAY